MLELNTDVELPEGLKADSFTTVYCLLVGQMTELTQEGRGQQSTIVHLYFALFQMNATSALEFWISRMMAVYLGALKSSIWIWSEVYVYMNVRSELRAGSA